MWYQVLVSAALVVGFPVTMLALRFLLNEFATRRELSFGRSRLMINTLRVCVLFCLLIGLLAVWGVDVKNVGLFLSSILGLVAIGFFAVWSILSNIVAGVFLFLSSPFKIDDEITVLPDDFRGRVIDMRLLFVVLRDDNGDVLHIPNNLLFQKVIKRIGGGESARSEDEGEKPNKDK